MKNKCPCCNSEVNYSLIPMSRDPDSEACCYDCLPNDVQVVYDQLCRVDEFFGRDASKYTDAQHVSNLVLLVGRLVQQVRNFTPVGEKMNENPVVVQAMGYLRRADLFPSVTRGVMENMKSD